MRAIHRRCVGLASIELVLLIPLLVLLAFGITEGGRAVYQYDTIAKSVRDAARYLSTLPPGQGHSTARCLALYGNTSCSGALLLPGLSSATFQVKDASNDSSYMGVPSTGNGGASTGQINLVRVRISGYVFDSLIPGYFPDVTFGPIDVTMRQLL